MVKLYVIKIVLMFSINDDRKPLCMHHALKYLIIMVTNVNAKCCAHFVIFHLG